MAPRASAADAASVAGPGATLDALLGRVQRRSVTPLRRSFVQPRGDETAQAPLARLVHGRRELALDLYLLAHALAVSPPWDVSEYAAVWARALGVTQHSGARSLVSNNWTWLETQRLIRTERTGAKRRVTLLDDGGTGGGYESPVRDLFGLPHAYWTFGWQSALDLPAKAVLLIGLSLGPDFLLPSRQGATWYGISGDSIKRGLRNLTAAGLLDVKTRRKSAPRSPTGFTFERRYTIRPLETPGTPTGFSAKP